MSLFSILATRLRQEHCCPFGCGRVTGQRIAVLCVVRYASTVLYTKTRTTSRTLSFSHHTPGHDLHTHTEGNPTTSTAATNTTAPSTAPSTTQAPFRLLNLPPELRERVYAYALDHPSQRAADIRYSALTRVSRQVRGEALPVFFAESNFIIDVGTNFSLLQSIFNLREFLHRWRELSGVPILKPAGKRLFKDQRNSAIFRDVSVHVHSAVKVMIDWYKPENGIEEAL
ncbi:hypothetical protein M409DRAFT_52515 [Zasmidium cellare ATCC 36951]|uniref:F-box domain-containing protein n=1 Tax=Zasmidium cellare ATCC 36951 TaxID=1080233 RepID=A0A6A6CTY1_ZASCE|nr:uncharacterized protein M409DRAFT_52515 [Zasmidium cellare ATCC 36951]KAF2169249.1 hypothetical protein M409DRAFT_52515 [Zasmidium cellare ATCC 36951]